MVLGDSIIVRQLSPFLSLLLIPEDMAVVCGVWQTPLGRCSPTLSGNLLYRYEVRDGGPSRNVDPYIQCTFSQAMGAVAVSHISKACAGANTFDVAKSWIAACFFLTMATNVICSGGLVYLSRQGSLVLILLMQQWQLRGRSSLRGTR
jgi:hypothetical protein